MKKIFLITLVSLFSVSLLIYFSSHDAFLKSPELQKNLTSNSNPKNVQINRDSNRRYDNVVRRKSRDGNNSDFREITQKAENLFRDGKYEKSMELYLLLAVKNIPSAYRRIGEMFHFGLGRERDYQEAYYWYLESFERGDSNAPNKIGRLFLNGEGFPKDEHEAIKWYKHSADRLNPVAMFNIGHLLEKSETLDSPARALANYRKAFKVASYKLKRSPFCKDLIAAID